MYIIYINNAIYSAWIKEKDALKETEQLKEWQYKNITVRFNEKLKGVYENGYHFI